MTKKIIIGLAGPEGVGKSTVARAICGSTPTLTSFKAVAYQASFALPLYEALAAMFKVSVEFIRENKNEPFTVETAPVRCLIGLSFRILLQRLGTEFGRNQIHADFWAQIAVKREEKVWAGKANIIVFDDVRFENEALQCDLVFELERPGVQYMKNHPSNMGLPSSVNRHLISLSKDQSYDAAKQIVRIAWDHAGLL